MSSVCALTESPSRFSPAQVGVDYQPQLTLNGTYLNHQTVVYGIDTNSHQVATVDEQKQTAIGRVDFEVFANNT